MEIAGLEPATFRVQGGRSPIELYPHNIKLYQKINKNVNTLYAIFGKVRTSIKYSRKDLFITNFQSIFLYF
jgi:hypothetical protein